MGTSIRVSEETKRTLEAVKREDETFDELLARIVVDRTEADVESMAGFGDEGIEAHMERERERLAEGFDENAEGE
jgi:predicted CopG family antitoxin